MNNALYTIQLFIIHNSQTLKDSLADIIEQKKALYLIQDISLHGDIDFQFNQMAKSLLIDEISKNLLDVSPEDVIIVVESLNITEFLK